MKLVEKYLGEDALKQMNLKVSRKDYADMQNTLKKLDSALKKEDEIEIKSASRTMISSAKRILDRF